ncbi:Meckel syndrome type 1 [Carabus blaptoides fortunei]
MNSIDLIHMNSGVYRCQDDIKNFKIRILLKKLIGPIPIKCGPVNCAAETEELTVSWQQKVLSKKEFNKYSRRRFCLTNQQKEYHRIIKTATDKPKRLYTFVHIDVLGDDEPNVTTETLPQMSDLHQQMSKLSLDKEDFSKAKNFDTSSTAETDEESTSFDIRKPLTSSVLNAYPENPYEYMIVMADLGHIDAKSKLWLHYEQMICIIKYDKVKKIFAIFPDFTKNTDVPYVLQTEMDRKIYYYFTLEHVSNVHLSNTEIEEIVDLEKIIESSVYRPVYNVEFECPAYDIYSVHVAVEIVCAKNFGFDPIFVQYNVDLPDHWTSVDCLDTCGTTQACTVVGLEHKANYSYNFDIDLEYTVQGNEEDLPKCPTIYFQVISLDCLDRYKVEGLTYKCLPVYTPGKYRLELQCLTVPDNIYNESIRKYFLGDYGNINDLSWLSIPKGYKGNVLNRYGVPTISTGSVEIRLNVLSQLNATGIYAGVLSDQNQNGNGEEKLNKTVNDVIDAYQKAKDAMMESRLTLTLE